MSVDTQVLDALLRVMRELRRHYDLSAREVGLTMSRARVVSTLAKMEGATQSELAVELEIEAPTLKRQVDALCAAGLIERQAMDGDARKRALFLTPAARQIRITHFMQSMRADLMAGISPEDQATTLAVLQQIERNAAGLRREE
ncbi:MarR family winged helix-turn-helix transcriptional regulator [Pseudodonghicola xiamenensis]|uniref:MarR family transcriptional regulator n=1 Tax=Pseudodonghicola xiamenensis TaxID=337702 RepID=A0A8J3H9E7_9RHOB|nr:MarR family transcriptional regulator [Pseudodonghicola xiamenensis]GHG93453.1 MarR family transcriptional regulator [Pseudodonghicola xiamenensis]